MLAHRPCSTYGQPMKTSELKDSITIKAIELVPTEAKDVTFKVMKGNRKTTDAHKDRIRASLSKKNMLHISPIKVNNKGQIIDGQHRLIAALEKGLTPYYISGGDLGMGDVILLNSTQKNWKMSDYLDYYVGEGYGHYITVKEFMKKENLGVSASLALLSVDPELKRRPIAPLSLFKRGGYTITNIEYALEFVEKIKELRKFTLGTGTWGDREFLIAVYELYEKKGVLHSNLVKKLSNYPHPLLLRSTKFEYFDQFETVLNFRSKKVWRS